MLYSIERYRSYIDGNVTIYDNLVTCAKTRESTTCIRIMCLRYDAHRHG